MPRKKLEKNKEEKPKEEKLNEKEIESLILDLAKQGMTSEKIGLKLKEKGINAKSHSLKINKVLKKNNLFEDADIKNLALRVEKMKKHSARNRQDHNVKRALSIKEAKLKKLREYRKK